MTANSSTFNSSTFNVALVQMRSGLTPAPNLDAAVRLIGEAKAGGADYVLTPEMTNILALKRELLFAAIVPEEEDVSLATFREIARKLSLSEDTVKHHLTNIFNKMGASNRLELALFAVHHRLLE